MRACKAFKSQTKLHFYHLMLLWRSPFCRWLRMCKRCTLGIFGASTWFSANQRPGYSVFGYPDSSACCFSRGKVGKYVVLQAFYKNFEDLGIKFYSCICGKIPKYFRHKGKTSEHGETNCFSQIWALNSALVRARRMLSYFWCGFSVNVKVKSVLYCFMSLNLYEF